MIGLTALALAALISVQPSEAGPPPECEWGPQGVALEACVNAAQPGTPWYALAHMNLGSRAAMQGDYATAVLHFDAAQPPGSQIESDSMFHAIRGNAYHRVGRSEEALADARLASEILAGRGRWPAEEANPDPDTAYALILPILYEAEDPAFETVLGAYLANPSRDLMVMANRAVTLLTLERYDEALQANAVALELGPNEPAVLNSQCYILTLMHRAAEGLPFCERAIALVPDVAPVRHSLAAALAGVGRCDEAEAELAQARRLDPAPAIYREPIPCSPA